MAPESEDYIPERRRQCSDKTCSDARAEWVKETLWPQIRAQVAMMIAGTVIFCVGGFVYLSKNAVRDFELIARDRFTTTQQHTTDLARIENKITALESSVGEHLQDVRAGLDRNLAAIQDMAKKR